MAPAARDPHAPRDAHNIACPSCGYNLRWLIRPPGGFSNCVKDWAWRHPEVVYGVLRVAAFAALGVGFGVAYLLFREWGAA